MRLVLFCFLIVWFGLVWFALLCNEIWDVSFDWLSIGMVHCFYALSTRFVCACVKFKYYLRNVRMHLEFGFGLVDDDGGVMFWLLCIFQ